ncbi:MAG TPA: lycopene cyclase [Chitinophagaceae bacterium]|nr:lycopene cyclase [Chitinophagaceae bacterium]HCT22054.1 lycopene cyclase [Chitinophagaceae bacterium]
MRMAADPFFQQASILLVDQSFQRSNDRTWCFWEAGQGFFESIVHHQWSILRVATNTMDVSALIAPYVYKMIRGEDFYVHCLRELRTRSNIEFLEGTISDIGDTASAAYVNVDGERLEAKFVFNSVLRTSSTELAAAQSKHHLLQHFKGWVIHTAEPVFDPTQATFMDFTVPQQYGTTFMYVLPTSTTTALVEYTLFTEQLLDDAAYNTALQQYIQDTLGILQYQVAHVEFGIIPMTNADFSSRMQKVINLGVAGGQAKPSSGFAFQFIQRKTAAIVAQLVKGEQPNQRFAFQDKKFLLYDSTLLHVLTRKQMPGDAIFSAIFQKNPMQRVLRFLENRSSLMDDLQIMRSVPTHIFMPAAIKEMFA